jgi:hypothetical protein
VVRRSGKDQAGNWAWRDYPENETLAKSHVKSEG